MKGSRHCQLNFNTSTGLPLITVVSRGLKIIIIENRSVVWHPKKWLRRRLKRFLTMKSLVHSTLASVKKVSFSSHPKTKDSCLWHPDVFRVQPKKGWWIPPALGFSHCLIYIVQKFLYLQEHAITSFLEDLGGMSGKSIKPWFVYWQDAIKQKRPSRDQTSLICCQSLSKKEELSFHCSHIFTGGYQDSGRDFWLVSSKFSQQIEIRLWVDKLYIQLLPK